jgi:hypothetical protein
VAVYPLAALTASKVTEADVEEEEVTVTLVGAATGVTMTAGEEEGEVEFAPIATTVME